MGLGLFTGPSPPRSHSIQLMRLCYRVEYLEIKFGFVPFLKNCVDIVYKNCGLSNLMGLKVMFVIDCKFSTASQLQWAHVQ